ncbi:Glia maturation factor gamma [Collichthys lucidus]|uniref:Glia maturation factor gamma n=1 Tax=Collichthys lucidus TaxID=240159 RepID=A0A4U5V184_COLLU|nr:Glia maturation factor gamma [Collichthys lucidus]
MTSNWTYKTDYVCIFQRKIIRNIATNVAIAFLRNSSASRLPCCCCCCPPFTAEKILAVQTGESSSLVVCEVEESLKDKLKKFRFRKETNNAAILMKIDMEKQLVILEEEYEVGCKPEQQMMYAGSKNQLVQTAELTKVFETRNADDLTEEWLKNQLAFFR